jgi:hypothetical protein
MSKKIVTNAVIALALSASASFAVDSTGCGFGSTLLKGQKGLVPQLAAVTTNGTSASQTFGITSGTMGCDKNGTITGGTGRIIGLYLQDNFDAFSLDAANGKGETINVIASIAGVSTEKAESVISANYDTLFSSENVDVATLSNQLVSLL